MDFKENFSYIYFTEENHFYHNHFRKSFISTFCISFWIKTDMCLVPCSHGFKMLIIYLFLKVQGGVKKEHTAHVIYFSVKLLKITLHLDLLIIIWVLCVIIIIKRYSNSISEQNLVILGTNKFYTFVSSTYS